MSEVNGNLPQPDESKEQFDIELNGFYCEDCLQGMKRIPEHFVDFICCDLPYGTIASAWDQPIPLDELWAQYERILKPNGVVALFGSEPFSTKLRMSKLDWYKYDWVWIKNRATGFQHARNMPLKKHELISIFSPGSMGHASRCGDRRMTYNPQGIVKCGEVWKRTASKFGNIVGSRAGQKNEGVREFTNYPTSILEFSKDERGFHPTQKPLELVRYLVRTYTNEGEVVLDNCMGSGTTAVACLKENRSYIGFEKDSEYFQKACERIIVETR